MLSKLLGLTVLGLSVLSSVVQAADIPANKTTKSVLPLGTSGLSGQFESLLDADWHKFNITKGDHYAVVLIPSIDGRFKQTLIDDQGKTRITTYGSSPSYPSGFEFTAGVTGLRYIGTKLERLY